MTTIIFINIETNDKHELSMESTIDIMHETLSGSCVYLSKNPDYSKMDYIYPVFEDDSHRIALNKLRGSSKIKHFLSVKDNPVKYCRNALFTYGLVDKSLLVIDPGFPILLSTLLSDLGNQMLPKESRINTFYLMEPYLRYISHRHSDGKIEILTFGSDYIATSDWRPGLRDYPIEGLLSSEYSIHDENTSNEDSMNESLVHILMTRGITTKWSFYYYLKWVVMNKSLG